MSYKHIKLDKIVQFSLNVLSDETSTDEDGGIVLDELNRLQGIIMNKYKHDLLVYLLILLMLFYIVLIA